MIIRFQYLCLTSLLKCRFFRQNRLIETLSFTIVINHEIGHIFQEIGQGDKNEVKRLRVIVDCLHPVAQSRLEICRVNIRHHCAHTRVPTYVALKFIYSYLVSYLGVCCVLRRLMVIWVCHRSQRPLIYVRLGVKQCNLLHTNT